MRGHVLPDAHQQRHHPGRWPCGLRGQDGLNQHLGHRPAPVLLHGLRGEGLPGGGGLLPERRPALQVRSRLFGGQLWKLGQKADERVRDQDHPRRLQRNPCCHLPAPLQALANEYFRFFSSRSSMAAFSLVSLKSFLPFPG